MSQRWLYDQFRWNVGRLKRRTETLNRMESSRFAEAMQRLDGSSSTTQLYSNSSSQQVLPDSSTHIRNGKKRRRKDADSDDEEGFSFRKHKKRKKKKKNVAQEVNHDIKSKVLHRDENYSQSNSESDLDLDKDMYPIQYYIKNRSDMIHEMFRTLRGRKLKAMLPQVLRKESLSSVRDMCLAELEVMSKKRVGRLLAGDENDQISSSGTEESTCSDKEELKVVGVVHVEGVGEGIVDSTSKSHEEDDVVLVPECNSAQSSVYNSDVQTTSRFNVDLDASIDDNINLVSPPHLSTSISIIPVVADLLDAQLGSPIEAENNVEEEIKSTMQKSTPEAVGCKAINSAVNIHKSSENQINESIASSENADGMTKTQMEILELEMRARAIRAMLRAQESRDKTQREIKNIVL